MTLQDHNIIIGIDFGTTYSGVAWVVSGQTEEPKVVQNWPVPGPAEIVTNDKVPSTITYLDGKPQKWGYMVGEDARTFQWFKVLLEPNSKYDQGVEQVEDSSKLLKTVGKTAQEVAADYLRLIWEHTTDNIRESRGDHYERNHNLRVILTVPAIWSPAAKENTLQAAQAAGLPDDITLLAEPEAAALAALQNKENRIALKTGDAFVVCDAGGGTVDLISYEVESIDPLTVRECAVSGGDLCGSIFLNLRFENCIATLVGSDRFYNESEDLGGIQASSRKKMMDIFEHRVKRVFTGLSDQDYSVELKGVVDDEIAGIEDDTIAVSVSMLKTIFDPIVLQIQALVEKQIRSVPETLEVKAILLVGGFGESTYLLDRLTVYQKRRPIHVHKVQNAWAAVCRGATMWGLEHPNASVGEKHATVASKLSLYSYGVVLPEDFDSAKGHLQIDRVLHKARGKFIVENQMIWLLKRGDRIKDHHVLHREFEECVQIKSYKIGNCRFEKLLYYCEDRNPPQRLKEPVEPLCKVLFSVPYPTLRRCAEQHKNPLTGEKWCICKFDLYVDLGQMKLQFWVKHNKVDVGAVEARYVNHFT